MKPVLSSPDYVFVLESIVSAGKILLKTNNAVVHEKRHSMDLVTQADLDSEQFLRQVGFVPQRFRGKVKIVGDGVVDVPITIRGVALSKSAREKILKAGGAVV